MRTTIDGAGRIVVPKALRDAMKLAPGQALDISLTDGHLEIVVPAIDVQLELADELPRAIPEQDSPMLTASMVRDVVEATRR